MSRPAAALTTGACLLLSLAACSSSGGHVAAALPSIVASADATPSASPSASQTPSPVSTASASPVSSVSPTARAASTRSSASASPTASATAAAASAAAAKADARQQWVAGSSSDAAEQGSYLLKAAADLSAPVTAGAAGTDGFATAASQLRDLASIPETDVTAAQMVEATSDVQALDTFFATPGLYS